MEHLAIIFKSKENIEITFNPEIWNLCDTVKSIMTCNSTVTTERTIEFTDFTAHTIKLALDYSEIIEYSTKHIIPKPLPINCNINNRDEMKAIYQKEQELVFIEKLYQNKDDYIELLRVFSLLVCQFLVL